MVVFENAFTYENVKKELFFQLHSGAGCTIISPCICLAGLDKETVVFGKVVNSRREILVQIGDHGSK